MRFCRYVRTERLGLTLFRMCAVHPDNRRSSWQLNRHPTSRRHPRRPQQQQRLGGKLSSRDPRGQFETGRVGVALSSVEDMQRIFEGIALDQVSTSTAMNGVAIVFLAQYVVAAQQQGVATGALRGTIQNDILKEYLARGTYIFPLGPSVRLVGDVIEWCINNARKFNPISVSAGHMQQAGATHIQSFAYTLANAQAYLDEVISRGYSVDQVAPLFSFLMPSTVYFLEAAANHRAARRPWATLLKQKYGAKEPASFLFRVATSGDQTELTAAQPINNLARITLHCVGAALGGSQSVILAAYDEAFDMPTEESFRATLMVQYIVQRASPVWPMWSIRWPTRTTWSGSPTAASRRCARSWTRSTAWAGWSAPSRRGWCSATSRTKPTWRNRTFNPGARRAWG